MFVLRFFVRKSTFENCWFTRAYRQLQVDLTETSAGCLYCLNSAELSNEGKANWDWLKLPRCSISNATSPRPWAESIFPHWYHHFKIHNFFSSLAFTFAQSKLMNQRAMLMIRDELSTVRTKWYIHIFKLLVIILLFFVMKKLSLMRGLGALRVLKVAQWLGY